MQQFNIQYKNIRHGYARIDQKGVLQITIPSYLRNNEGFKEKLIQKGKKLLNTYQKKEHILTSDKDSVLLFGERVPLTDVAPTLKKLPKALKKLLEEYAGPHLMMRSKRIGINIKKLIIRKTKSKRGSCTSDRDISLNLDLVHLPTKYIKYVIIHEICHLKVHNHSKKFRALVESFCPDYKTIRKEMGKMVLK